jgi:hypothetical protein
MGYVVWMPVQAKGSWLGEGDDPTFMNMLGNGLRAYEKSYYGGWGGRQLISSPAENVFAPMSDTSQQAMVSALSSMNNPKNANAYPDFFPAAQRDLAARLQWSVTSKYRDANHAPIIKIEGPLNVIASAGQKIRLNGTVSDPDKNLVSVKWWQFYTESYQNKVIISNPGDLKTEVLIPKDASQTIHLILEATDNGTPALTSYQRIIIKVRENN